MVNKYLLARWVLMFKIVQIIGAMLESVRSTVLDVVLLQSTLTCTDLYNSFAYR
jgi:hypothetical protein